MAPRIVDLAVKLRRKPTSKSRASVSGEPSLGGRSAAAAKTGSKAHRQETCVDGRRFGLGRCLAAVIAAVLVLPPAVGAQSAANRWTATRTPDGQPDLQGYWTNATVTPLERPAEFAGKDFLTEKEAIAYEKQKRLEEASQAKDDIHYDNVIWQSESYEKGVSRRRTSLIVDPADGRMPPLVPLSPDRQQARAMRAGANARFNAGLPNDVYDMSLPVRCIIRTDSPPYLPTIYNNNFHIFQSPGYVAIAPEMIHSARIIPLDSRPHLGSSLHQWLGDTRGRWDGNTLVVETTNFRSDDGVVFQGGNPATFRITERFTRVDADTLTYQFTVEDPATWTRIDPAEQMYEYACHEDNFDIVHFLTGARAREKRGETVGPPPAGAATAGER